MTKRAHRILVVDDEELNRELLHAMLSSIGYEVDFAEDGFQALSMVKLDFDLVLLDVMMPGMDGFEVAQKIREGEEFGDVPICMVTALAAKKDRLRAVDAGANDFITKPVDKLELKVRVASLIRMKETQDEIKRHQEELEGKVEQRTIHLKQALKDAAEGQRQTYQAQLETIERLAVAAEYKDEDTGLHVRRMSRYCHLLAVKLSLTPHDCEIILNASPMHDVGKMGIPDAILLKPAKLDADEWEIMKRHTIIGGKILGGSSSELLQAGETIALSHHEKWDGSGYPNGLSGEGIPLMGRIAALADVFDALTNKRPYKDAFSNEQALQIIKEGKGKHFDPTILDVFLENLGEIEKIQSQYLGS
jgi:putative two-component system response regulator